MSLERAVRAVEQHGMLLVFPINNRAEPRSLWSVLYPRSKMRWEWDEGGDNRVSKLWFLREELSLSRRVVYSKWYRGRATLFSREVFVAMLSAFGSPRADITKLGRDSRRIMEFLRSESPVSTKALKKMSGLQGREKESAYNKALKQLWERLLIVAYGEVDEGAFPSLAVGATNVLFEDLWADGKNLPAQEAEEFLRAKLGPSSLFHREFIKVKKTVPAPEDVPKIPSVIYGHEFFRR